MKNKKFISAQWMMILRIIDFAFAPDNVAITSGIPALLNLFNTLKSKVTDISALFDQYQIIITGIALQKKHDRIALANSTYTIVCAVRSYAIANNDLELAAQMKFTLSRLQNMPFVDFINAVNGRISIVQPLLASLADYNITSAMFAQWQSDAEAFDTIMIAPQSAITNHKTLGWQIETSVKDAMDIVRNGIDGIVTTLMQSQPGYYNGYRAQRRIAMQGHRHNHLEASVVNELGQSVPGAKVTVNEFTDINIQMGETKTYKAKSALTDLNGTTTVSKFFAATRTVTISGTGIATKTYGPFLFEQGKTLKQTFTVQPSFNNLPETKTAENETEKVK